MCYVTPNYVPIKSETCPNCGYCPHCGRKAAPSYPTWPSWPSYPTAPWRPYGPWWGVDLWPTTEASHTVTIANTDGESWHEPNSGHGWFTSGYLQVVPTTGDAQG